jgi:hypothetical protein
VAHVSGLQRLVRAARGLAGALLAVLLLAQQAGPALATDLTAEEALAERRIKAAYLYRFAGYAEWPEGAFARPDSPLSIGIWGNDELADDLARLVATRTIDGRRFEVRRVRLDTLAGVHVLFITRERLARVPGALAAAPRGTLVVTESEGALQQGSAVNFVTIEGQIRFELSLEAAERRGLKLSSRLVAVSNNLAGRR